MKRLSGESRSVEAMRASALEADVLAKKEASAAKVALEQGQAAIAFATKLQASVEVALAEVQQQRKQLEASLQSLQVRVEECNAANSLFHSFPKKLFVYSSDNVLKIVLT